MWEKIRVVVGQFFRKVWCPVFPTFVTFCVNSIGTRLHQFLSILYTPASTFTSKKNSCEKCSFLFVTCCEKSSNRRKIKEKSRVTTAKTECAHSCKNDVLAVFKHLFYMIFWVKLSPNFCRWQTLFWEKLGKFVKNCQKREKSAKICQKFAGNR